MKSYIRLGDNNKNQWFPYSSTVSASIEILQSPQKLKEAKMCGITLYWYFFEGLSRIYL